MLKVLSVIVALVAIAGVVVWPTAQFILGMGATCAAKTTCSALFVSNRSFTPFDLPLECSFGVLPYLVDVVVDHKEKTVLSRAILGADTQVAKYFDDHRGCSVLPSSPLLAAAPRPKIEEKRPDVSAEELWPRGNRVEFAKNSKLQDTIAKYFVQPDVHNTRAILVVRNGQIVYEQYAQPNFGPDTALLGWSMTKSLTHALVGARVKQGKMSLNDPVHKFIPELARDNRSAITINHLLKMSSGLKWQETYSIPTILQSDVISMLYRYDSAPARPLEKPLGWAPGTTWCYSSGDSNVLSLALRNSFDNNDEYWTYPAKALFNKIGARSAVMETDRNGTFVGSSFSYATARDWARFGLLYLRDGVWVDGERLLPEGWSKHAAEGFEPSGNIYGSHWWRRVLLGRNPCHPDPEHMKQRVINELPLWPEDAFLASGYAGQFVVVIPSQDTIIVRLGYAPSEHEFSVYNLIVDVLQAMK